MHTSQKQHQSLAFMTQLALYAKNTVKSAQTLLLEYTHTVALFSISCFQTARNLRHKAEYKGNFTSKNTKT